jgi:hypothetical protein
MARRPWALRAPNLKLESELQLHVVRQLRMYLPDDVWFTVSLSGLRLPPQVAARAKAAGMEKGAPDLSFIFPDGVTRYIELKQPKGVLSPEQARLALVLGPKRFAVCRAWPEVREVLSSWMEAQDLAFLDESAAVRRALAREGERRDAVRSGRALAKTR